MALMAQELRSATSPVRIDPVGTTRQPVTVDTITATGLANITVSSITASGIANINANTVTASGILNVNANTVTATGLFSVNANTITATGRMAISLDTTTATGRIATSLDTTTASGNFTIVGNVAHDGVDSGNPAKVGGRAVTAQITELAAGDRSDFLFDLRGKALVTHGTSLSVATLDKTAAAAAAIVAAPGAGQKLRLRGFGISSEGTEVVTARIRMTIGTVNTIIWHQSTDDQVGSIHALPGYIDGDTNTAINAELSGASTNGVLFTVYYEQVTA